MRSEPLAFKEFIALFAALMALTALSIDILLPAFPAIQNDFGVQDGRDLQLLITVFIFGMVFGELIFGPLSDERGRKPALLIGLCLYIIGTIMAVWAETFASLLIARCLQGLGVAGPKIASRALIRDLYQGDAMARVMSFILMVFIFVPMLAPAVGQGVLLLAGWRWIFTGLFVFAVIVGLWFSLRQPETLCEQQRVPIRVATLWSSIRLLITHPHVMGYTVLSGLLFGAVLLYLGIAQSIFHDIYGVGTLFPLYFAGLSLGIGMASFTNARWVMRIGAIQVTRWALWVLAIASSLLLLSCFFQSGVPSFFYFLLLCFFILFGCGLLFGNVNALAMQDVGEIAGVAASVMAALSSFIAVCFSLLMGRFYDMTLYTLAIAFMLVALCGLSIVSRLRRF